MNYQKPEDIFNEMTALIPESYAGITTEVSQGILFPPIHFGKSPTHILTGSDVFEPLAKIPEFKVSAVQLRKLEV